MTRYRVLFISSALVLLSASCGDEAKGPSLAEGDEAPGFTLASAAGGKVALSDFSEKKPVLLYFSMGPG